MCDDCRIITGIIRGCSLPAMAVKSVRYFADFRMVFDARAEDRSTTADTHLNPGKLSSEPQSKDIIHVVRWRPSVNCRNCFARVASWRRRERLGHSQQRAFFLFLLSLTIYSLLLPWMSVMDSMANFARPARCNLEQMTYNLNIRDPPNSLSIFDHMDCDCRGTIY